MAIGAVVVGFGAALEAGSMHIAMVFIGRLITGIGEGLFLSITAVKICEAVPAKDGDIIASAPQRFASLDLVVVYFFCFSTVTLDSSLAWRLLFAFPSLCAFSWALCDFVLPQAPRWLEAQGNIMRMREYGKTLGMLKWIFLKKI